jgi:hypothetical protein
MAAASSTGADSPRAGDPPRPRRDAAPRVSVDRTVETLDVSRDQQQQQQQQ